MKKILIATLLLTTCSGLLLSCLDHREPGLTPGLTTVATGLKGPIGVEIEASGRVWVAEAGTGKNDGQVSIIGGDGIRIPAITGFTSALFQGEIDGLSHLLFADGLLYILHSNHRLYKVNVANFKTGDPPLQEKDLPFEDIGAFVIAQPVADNPDKASHAYQMSVGPDGDLFFADAAANVIVRRSKATGAFSIFANIPGFANPTPVGPPAVQSVPTGIVFDGQKFLVSTLTGFPFPAGQATVYQITTAGIVSVYQKGFNPLTAIDLNNGPLVLEYATFGPQGWTRNTGRLLRVNNPGTTVLAAALNQPTGLKKIDANHCLVTSLGDGTLLKITF